MTTVVFATLTSVLFGSADFFGGLASRRDSAFSVTATAHVLGLFILGAAAVVGGAELVTRPDLLWGALAGVSGGIGVVALYGGLAAGRMSVVAPVTAGLAGSLPAVFDLLRGTAIGVTDGAGLVLAVVAVIIVSRSSDGESGELPFVAVVLAVVAGFGFAGSWLSFSMTEAASGFWPLLSSRAVSVTMLSAAAMVRARHVLADPGVRTTALAAGGLDSLANLTMITAIRSGPLAVASVLGSLYPVVTVLMAYKVLEERVTRLQAVGIGLALVAVTLTALP